MPYIEAKRALSPVFESEPFFLFDDPQVFEEASALDSSTVAMDLLPEMVAGEQAEQTLANHDVIFVVSDRQTPESSSLTPFLRGRNVLHLPAYAFCGDKAHTRYLLDMCRALDLEDCVKRNNEVIRRLSSHHGRFELLSEKSDTTFTLGSRIKMMQTASRALITDGADLSLASFTEVALIPRALEKDEGLSPSSIGYDVSGSFQCDGCLIATHLGTPKEVENAKIDLLNLFRKTRRNGGFPLRVVMKESKTTEILTKNGEDILPAILPYMHELFGSNILELALGTNERANAKSIDWSFNSPVNESALGFHIGLGDGTACPHIDLICCDERAYENFFGLGGGSAWSRTPQETDATRPERWNRKTP